MLRHLIDRPVTVTMAMFVVIVLGLVSLKRLPVSLAPDLDIPYITVQVNASEMSAREIDESVLNPLRQQFIQINALEDIVTEARDGSGTLRLTFGYGENLSYLFIEVNEKIDRAMGSLPDIERPKVLKSSAIDIPAFYINVKLSGTCTPSSFARLSAFVRDVLCKRIEQLPEVAMVDYSGVVSDEIVIIPDSRKLVQLGLGTSDFEQIIRNADIRLGSLSIRDGQYRYNVNFLSEVSGKEDIENIWFRHGEKVMQVKEIASVQEQPAARQGLVRSGGENAVSLAVIKQSGTRMSDLRNAISLTVDDFSRDYPEVSFELTRDQTQLLDYSIHNLLRNIILGVLMVCIVIFLFMRDLRSPALVCLTMPLALVASMAVFYAAGMTLNIISLSGLLLGVGMMADNTIILVDNITARWQRGSSLRDSVLEGTREVTGPMLSSILTTCAVFIPLVFVSGIAGALFYDQAMSVTIVLLTSYLVTITVIPVFYYVWYKGCASFRPVPFLDRLQIHEPMLNLEEICTNWFMRHPIVSWSIPAVSAAGIVLCAALMPKEKLPPVTYTETILNIDWNEQVSLEQNVKRVSDIESLISDRAETVTSMVGIQQFILRHSGDNGSTEASVYIKCPDERVLADVRGTIESHLAFTYPRADFSFAVSDNIFEQIFGSSEPRLLARLRPVSSPELEIDKVRTAVSDLRAVLQDVMIQSPAVKTDMVFVADPEMMALYGVSLQDLVNVLRNALSQNKLFSIVRGSRTVPVVMGTGHSGLIDVLNGTFVRKDGIDIPVASMMRQTYVEDLKKIISGVDGNYYPVEMDMPQKCVPDAMKAVKAAVDERGDFEVSFSGSWFSSRKITAEMAWIFLLATLLLYLILASQFESLIQPLLIMAEILVDVFASLLLLWVLGVSINLMSLIGLVVVSGIVINDSILKVDTINRLRKSGLSLERSVIEASSRRMKAIIMTSLTTILAVLPFLSRGNMGDDLQYPMSLVIIAGMTVGTIVSLFVLPALYYSVYRKCK